MKNWNDLEQAYMHVLYYLVGYLLCHNHFLIYMWYYTSYQLISVTVVAFTSVHKIATGTNMGLYLTHANL